MLRQINLRVQVRLSRKTKIPTISSKLDLYTAVLQVDPPVVRDSRASRWMAGRSLNLLGACLLYIAYIIGANFLRFDSLLLYPLSVQGIYAL